MRPHIICQMVTSIDGRLHPSRYTVPPAGVSWDVLRGHSDRIYDLLGVDGWMVGRRTMSEMSKGTPPTVKDAPPLPRTTHVGRVNGRKLAVAVDASGRVRYGSDNILGDHVVAVLGEKVSDQYLAELREIGASYLFAGPQGDDPGRAMEELASSFGVKRLLLQGGGKINGGFLKHKLIDEFSTLIYPAVHGVAGTQSIIDYEGPEGDRPGMGQSLRLTHCEALDGGVVWLRHSVEQAPA